MFFKRRGGAELISIIISLVFLGAAAIGIEIGLLLVILMRLSLVMLMILL